MAGRNKQKLEHEREDLAKDYPAVRDVPILTGDAKDLDSIVKIATQTKVLISTSGPYAKIGGSVVKACVAAGTHYCDITGGCSNLITHGHAHLLRPFAKPHWLQKAMSVTLSFICCLSMVASSICQPQQSIKQNLCNSSSSWQLLLQTLQVALLGCFWVQRLPW